MSYGECSKGNCSLMGGHAGPCDGSDSNQKVPIPEDLKRNWNAAIFFGENACKEYRKLIERIATQAAELSHAGEILGKICVAGTLLPGEELKDAPYHAAMKAMLDMVESRNKLHADLTAAQQEITRLKNVLAEERHD